MDWFSEIQDLLQMLWSQLEAIPSIFQGEAMPEFQGEAMPKFAIEKGMQIHSRENELLELDVNFAEHFVLVETDRFSMW